MSGRVLGSVVVAVVALSAASLGYLAGRTTPSTAPVAAAEPGPGTPAATPAAAVAETEAVVPQPDPAPVERAATAPAPAPVESPAPVARTRPVSRSAPARREPAPSRAEPRPVDPSPSVAARAEAPRTLPAEPIARPTMTPEPLPEVRPSEDHTPVAEPAPPVRRTEDFVVPADSVIGLRLDDTISTETARIEQRVQAHVSRDVLINGTIVIPANSRAEGEVTLVEAGGKFRERARLGVRFHTLVLADGTSVPIQTDVIYRDGQAVASRSAARIGGSAVGGAIIGAIFGGGKGAAIGAAAGAGAGTAATMATQKSHATLNAGSTVTVRLTNPTTVTVERENND